MSDFLSAAGDVTEALRAIFPPTPLQRNDHLSARFGADIWLKREDLSPVRSYKIRGAVNAMRKSLANQPDRRLFVCASAGNHAQGVAYACRHFGVKGVIFMPVTTPGQKIAKTRIFGGDQIEIRLFGDYFDQSLAAAQSLCREAGGQFLSPFDDDDVIEGQASIAAEIRAQLGGWPDLMVLPVGGGGLSAGVRRYLRAAGAPTALHLVEPAGGASLGAALAAGAPITLPRVDSFVDGAAVARIGTRTFAELRSLDPRAVSTAPEDRICTTILEMLNIEGVVLEPAGALAIDALSDLRSRIAGKQVVCLASGGNFDFERLPEVKERALRFSGLKKYFILRLPQRPGALRDFLALLGPEDDIARFEYLKKSARNFGTVLIGIETTAPGNLEELFARMTDAGLIWRDITDDETLASFLI